MALTELYFRWKDKGRLDYGARGGAWEKVTGFTASQEAIAFLLRQLTDIKNEVPDETGNRESVELWKDAESGEIDRSWLEHLDRLIQRLAQEQGRKQKGTGEEDCMELLEQCQVWHENDEYKRIIDTLEAIPERTPEMDSELARAYNNLAAPEGRELLKKALALLKPHEEYFQGNHCWNFRMGYSYYYLDQEGRALPYFRAALEACPGDEDTQEFIDWCEKGIALPRFSACFRERTEEWWDTFAELEGELRQIMDEDKHHQRGEELVARMDDVLSLVFDEISFEMGFNGKKYELILTPEGDKVKLFELSYFQKHAPEKVLEHWNILVGRQPAANIGLRTDDGWDISGEDVQVWLEERGEHSFAISAYCETLLPLLRENENRAWWMLTTLTDQVLGEIPHMRYIDDFDVLEAPREEPSLLLSQLPEKLREKGLDLSTDPESCLESYTGYQMKPNEDPDADWRLDTIAGSTCCTQLLNGYLNADNGFMDGLHADGAVAGFLCYPLDALREEEGSEKIFAFRDRLEEKLAQACGPEALTLIGGATGLYCGYVDFIAWDLSAVLKEAQEVFFADADIPWASFHAFRREAATVPLKFSEPDEPEQEERPDEPAETLTGMDDIPYAPENADAFYQRLEQWNDADEYTRCIQALDAIPEDWRDYRCAYALGRALENYAIIGDHDEGTPNDKGDKALLRAVEVLESVREEGQDKAEWNMRMAYAYQYLYGQEEKAIPYARRWAELDPEDENAPAVIRECQEEIRKRRCGRKKKVELVPGALPFEGFDLTGFWDDNMYALKEYVSEPPSDELIASVEEELGYKLPASYIWLMERHNGGIPVNTCHPTDEPTSWAEDHVAITGIFGIGREKSCSLCGELGSQFMIDEWEYPAIGVAICDCPSAGHDMIFLDYRACGPQGEPAVVHVDQENDYKITHLADSFEAFIRGLENESAYDLDEDEDPDTEDGSAGSAEGACQPELYNTEEMEAVEEHIKRYFGSFEHVYHELVSPDIHVDICVAPPSKERDYCTLVTMGMGAHRMNVPEELAEYKLERAELAIALPKDWKLDQESMQDERWYWPIRLLKSLARLPINCDSWLGHGHTVEGREPFADNTKLCTAVLVDPQGTEEGSEVCALPGGEEVNFYQVIPLYEGELDYKLKHDADALLDKMAGISFVVQPDRPNAITRGTVCGEEDAGGAAEMDDAIYHLESIREKELPIDAINAYSHMAIFLRWCMEHDLLDEAFMGEYSAVVERVKADPGCVDLRKFIRDELEGRLLSSLFNKVGRAFACYYYGENDAPCYPGDIDDYALDYFGPARYHSDEFRQEAYLFIPFDEEYYRAMAEMIGERFVNWQGQDFDEDSLEPSDVAQAVMEYLDCECTYFPSMKDDDPIMSAYSYARRLGVREGFVPVLIKPDETLLECLVLNSDSEHQADCYEFDLKAVEEYRKNMLAAPMKDGKGVLEELIGRRKEEAEDDDLDWAEDILGEIDDNDEPDGEDELNRRFASYWCGDTNMTYPLLLAKIPVKNPWEVFAYLPFGNWNECPDTPELMAVTKYWFEQYGAAPAVMSHDELEFGLLAPIPREKAMEVAVEQYGFCPDMDQNFEQLGILADTLWQSAVWYFWWD